MSMDEGGHSLAADNNNDHLPSDNIHLDLFNLDDDENQGDSGMTELFADMPSNIDTTRSLHTLSRKSLRRRKSTKPDSVSEPNTVFADDNVFESSEFAEIMDGKDGPSSKKVMKSLAAPMAQRKSIRQIQVSRRKSQRALSQKSLSCWKSFQLRVAMVDLGSGYWTKKAGAEIITYLANSCKINSIIEPLKSGSIRYCSVMNDGSSSVKTMDKKELYLMKTAHRGVPEFSLMFSKEPDGSDAEGLKAALETSFRKALSWIERSQTRCWFRWSSCQLCAIPPF